MSNKEKNNTSIGDKFDPTIMNRKFEEIEEVKYSSRFSIFKMGDIVVGNCGEEGEDVRWKFDILSGKLIIYGLGEMDNYTLDKEKVAFLFNEEGVCTSSYIEHKYDISGIIIRPWASYYHLIKSVEIQKGVTKIGDMAFYGCRSLVSVAIPEGIECISWKAFTNCTSLESITIPDSVSYISSSAFKGCSSLTEITIPESVMGISNYAFQDCSSLRSITIPPAIEIIEWSTFQGCRSLVSVTIPESVTYISKSAFSGCSSLSGVTFPKNLECVGYSSFNDCSSLTRIVFLGNIVPEICPHCFDNIGKSGVITVPRGTIQAYSSTLRVCGDIKIDDEHWVIQEAEE